MSISINEKRLNEKTVNFLQFLIIHNLKLSKYLTKLPRTLLVKNTSNPSVPIYYPPVVDELNVCLKFRDGVTEGVLCMK